MSHQPAWPAFSTDEFLGTLRDVYFPGARPAIVECRGQRFRTLVHRNNRPLLHFWQFPFYLEPLGDEVSAELAVPFLNPALLALTSSSEAGPPGSVVSPWVDWSSFASFRDFATTRPARLGIDSPRTVLRKARKLERESGPVTFCFDDDDSGAFEQTLAWKSEQYRRTGIPDRLALTRNRDLLYELRARGTLVFSTLRADGRFIAGNITHRLGGRMISRLPAYDTQFSRYSPGSVLTYRVLESTFNAGFPDFDFLGGSEGYKFAYATHCRWFGSLGTEPPFTRIQRVTRAAAGGALHRFGPYQELRRRFWR